MDFGSSRFSQARLPFSTSSSSSPSSSSNQYKTTDPSNSIIWDPHLMQFNPHKTPDQMESPTQDYDSRGNVVGVFVEKEHMFDKVVTPSDVGKLNRLVIPKQHAEKYFPLDSTTHEKGLLLNFEDRNGKSWRFRYSYWTSSQSYVMTKGWSRFVKEKRLDAGDVVSFKRGVGELEKDRFYIDWRRRLPDTTSVEQLNIFHHHQHHGPIPHHFHLQQWTNPSIMRPVGVGVGLATPLSVPRDHVGQLSQNNVSHLHNPYHRNNVVTNSHGIVSFSGGSYGYGTVINPCQGGGPVYYLRSEAPGPVPPLPRGGEAEAEPIVIESVPVAHEKAAAGKRLRLFGVNMECSSDDVIPSETETETDLQFELYSGSRRAMPRLPSTDYFDKGKSSSSSPMSLDFGT